MEDIRRWKLSAMTLPCQTVCYLSLLFLCRAVSLPGPHISHQRGVFECVDQNAVGIGSSTNNDGYLLYPGVDTVEEEEMSIVAFCR